MASWLGAVMYPLEPRGSVGCGRPQGHRRAQRSVGFGGSIRAIGSNLLSAVTPRPLFDVILSSPPSFAGEPRDLADRAWHAGPNYSDIVMLFAQARERLASDGSMYLLLSTDSDLGMLGNHIKRAGFAARLVAEHSIFIESFLLYEFTVQSASSMPFTPNPLEDD
jgi:release factor glutamine methyltransferase